ncbi:MAG: TetR/AcrR family transcriptional regulator [Pseudomonadota bacterium]
MATTRSGPTKARILAAASQLLLEQGTTSLSVRAIAQQAGVSTMGIYSHFDGKQGVFDALYREGFERLARALERALKIPDPREAARLGTQLYLELAQDYESHYRLMFGERAGRFEPSETARADALRAFELLVQLMAKLMPVRNSGATHLCHAVAFWAQLHGYVSLQQQMLPHLPAQQDWDKQVLRTMDDMIERLAQGDVPGAQR